MNWDIMHGVILVLGEGCTARTGTIIGSPVAAGASSLTVAYCEEEYDRSLTAEEYAMLTDGMIRIRWLDDLLLAVEEPGPDRLKEIESEITQEEFYGEELRLKETEGTEAFGFLTETDATGDVIVKQRQMFHKRQDLEKEWKDFQDAEKPPIRVGIHGGNQWRAERVSYGVAVGYLMRVLDMTNGEQVMVEQALQRAALEVLHSGTTVKVVRKAVKRLRPVAWCNLKGVRRALMFPGNVQRAWCAMHEEAERDRSMRQELVREVDAVAALWTAVV